MEGFDIGFIARLNAHYNVAVHLDEAAVAVPREARILGFCGEPFDGFVVEPQVEDCVHHPWHRLARTRADGKEQGVFFVAEDVAHLLFDRLYARLDLRVEARRVFLPVFVEIGADFGCDCEAGGDWQTDSRHFGEVCALAAEEIAHFCVAVGFYAEQVGILFIFCVCRRFCGSFLLGFFCSNFFCHSLLSFVVSVFLFVRRPTRLRGSAHPNGRGRGRRYLRGRTFPEPFPIERRKTERNADGRAQLRDNQPEIIGLQMPILAHRKIKSTFYI